MHFQGDFPSLIYTPQPNTFLKTERARTEKLGKRERERGREREREREMFMCRVCGGGMHVHVQHIVGQLSVLAKSLKIKTIHT